MSNDCKGQLNRPVVPTLWTVGDVAQHLQVAVQSVYRWASHDEIPHLKVGGLTRFDPNEIQEWLSKKPKRRGRPPKGLQN